MLIAIFKKYCVIGNESVPKIIILSDVGDLPPVLTFTNCVLNTGVNKWPLKLHVYTFLRPLGLRFFQNPKTRLLMFSELLHTFSRTLHFI